jgi:aspartyl-tRNA(Asn)/glutamyl-tRNA(Gln) amidotransferase subunit C
MKIDQQALSKIAHLSRLEIAPAEEPALIQSLESVLSWMEQLEEIDTTGVEPLTHIASEINVMREDIIGQHLSREKGLLNAPSHSESYFKVPKVIE